MTGRKKAQRSISAATISIVVLGCAFFSVKAWAGSLDPSAAPAPTMRTLEELTPAWSKKIPCSVDSCPRFQVLADFNNQAVLDKETGLVWEKAPPTSTLPWANAIMRCMDLNLGGRKGWHLPTFEQLASLVQVDQATFNPALPNGHPFANVQMSYYWSATSYVANFTRSLTVAFGYGDAVPLVKTDPYYSWCVRGGQSQYDY